jgi:hypothetical protein
VLDCTNGEVQPGYSFLDLKSPDGVACSGRVQDKGCHTLQVTFRQPVAASLSGSLWWAGALGFLLAGLSGLVWYRAVKSKESNSEITVPGEAPIDQIHFGQTTFYPSDQSLTIGGTSQTLTYRETKLLRLFAGHPNQLLEREYILKSVWEDEGTTVDRSVNVFVSRLRKLVWNPPTLCIASAMVDYRLKGRLEAE